jgi:hypothetical protein
VTPVVMEQPLAEPRRATAVNTAAIAESIVSHSFVSLKAGEWGYL